VTITAGVVASMLYSAYVEISMLLAGYHSYASRICVTVEGIRVDKVVRQLTYVTYLVRYYISTRVVLKTLFIFCLARLAGQMVYSYLAISK